MPGRAPSAGAMHRGERRMKKNHLSGPGVRGEKAKVFWQYTSHMQRPIFQETKHPRYWRTSGQGEGKGRDQKPRGIDGLNRRRGRLLRRMYNFSKAALCHNRGSEAQGRSVRGWIPWKNTTQARGGGLDGDYGTYFNEIIAPVETNSREGLIGYQTNEVARKARFGKRRIPICAVRQRGKRASETAGSKPQGGRGQRPSGNDSWGGLGAGRGPEWARGD